MGRSVPKVFQKTAQRIFPCFRLFFVFCFLLHHKLIMRLSCIVLIVSLAACQTTVPVPGKRSNPQSDTTDSIHNQTGQNDGNPTPSSQSMLNQTHTQSSQANGSGESGKNKQEQTIKITSVPRIETQAGWPEIIYLVFSFLLVAVGGFQVWLLCRTLLFTRRQSHEMKRQRVYMRFQWKAMQDQVGKMERQLVEMSQQTSVMTPGP